MTFKGESDNGAGKLQLGIFMVLQLCEFALSKAEARVPVWVPCRLIMNISHYSLWSLDVLEIHKQNSWDLRPSFCHTIGVTLGWYLGMGTTPAFSVASSISRKVKKLFPTMSLLLEFCPYLLGQCFIYIDDDFLAIFSSNPFTDYWTILSSLLQAK